MYAYDAEYQNDEGYDDNNGDYYDDDGTEEYEVDELMEAINNGFIPRRSAQPYLRTVFPAGFANEAHRKQGVPLSLNEQDAVRMKNISVSV